MTRYRLIVRMTSLGIAEASLGGERPGDDEVKDSTSSKKGNDALKSYIDQPEILYPRRKRLTPINLIPTSFPFSTNSFNSQLNKPDIEE